jgi:hypothetical protein
MSSDSNLSPIHTEWIFLPGNNIFGTIPTQIGELTLLSKSGLSQILENAKKTKGLTLALTERLQLTTNLLEGTIPTEFGRITKLGKLMIHSFLSS